MRSKARLILRRPLIPWIVLLVSLMMTAITTWSVANSTVVRDKERWTNAVESTRNRIETRLQTYIALLRGGAGLYAAADMPIFNRDFQEYTARLDIQRRYPGIQGIGFTRRFLPEEKDSLVAAMKAQGFSDFKVWPDAPEGERHTIVYLSPLDRRNRAAIGYDMYTEATRREAMARARDWGTSAMSGKVRLVQEIEGRVQAGFLIYLPVYEGGEIPQTVEERRAALKGFVYAPFRADDLFDGIFGEEERPRLAFRIYDGREVNEENLLHDSRIGGIVPDDNSSISEQIVLETSGHPWTIVFRPTPFFTAESRRSFVPFTALFGFILSLTLFALSRTQLQAEEAVRESEGRLRSVLESLPVGVFVAERNGQITFTNSASKRIWAGGTEVIEENPDAFERWWAEMTGRIQTHGAGLIRALQGQKVEGETVEIGAFDGSVKSILVSAFPLRNKSGEIERAVTAVVDVTEQRKAEIALREREREFRTMVDSIPQLAWMADYEGNIFWYNQRWYEYTGTTFEIMQREGWHAVHHPDHAERVSKQIKRSFETGIFWEDTFPIRSKTGEYRHFLSQAVPIRDDSGKVVRWFGTSTDITEQHRAREAEARAIRELAAREAAEAREEQLRQHTMELERSNRELEEFAYIASHDLQEPLRKISTFADLILEEDGDNLGESGRLYLQRVQHAAVRMSRLIKDLLAFSRVRTKALPFEKTDLGVVMAEVISDLEVLIKKTGGRVHFDELPTIEADPVQLRQLLQNLIANALKFHQPDVPPEVRISCRIETARYSREADGRQFCRIEVKDNGIGFEEKYVDRIFAPFQRLHRKDQYEGTGIGLAICRRIVERHGGSITARSEPGKGSQMIVCLPIHQNHEESA
jgi:PAS domain S-box-containing protein